MRNNYSDVQMYLYLKGSPINNNVVQVCASTGRQFNWLDVPLVSPAHRNVRARGDCWWFVPRNVSVAEVLLLLLVVE